MSTILVCSGIGMALRQWSAHRQLNRDGKIDEPGYQHSERQIHRRLSISGLLFLIGLMILTGDQLGRFFGPRPGFFFAYWVTVLLLVFVMVMIALFDLLSTIAYARVGQVRLREERRAIEEDIRRYRANRERQSHQDPGLN